MDIKVGETYKTRGGDAVEVLKIDILGDNPIVGVITNKDGTQSAMTFNEEGSYITDIRTDGDLVSLVRPYDEWEIDDKALFWNNDSLSPVKGYFAGTTKEGNPAKFIRGQTSYTTSATVEWNHARLWIEGEDE